MNKNILRNDYDEQPQLRQLSSQNHIGRLVSECAPNYAHLEPFYSLDQSLLRGNYQTLGYPQHLQLNRLRLPKPSPIFTFYPSAFRPPKELESRRQQHTIKSLGVEKSKSRSPIVASDLDFYNISHNPHGERIMSSPNNRHEQTSANRPDKPLVSSQSFERRKSVFEQDQAMIGNCEAINNFTDNSLQLPQRPQRSSDECDSLSLDQILADLQAGKLVYSSLTNGGVDISNRMRAANDQQSCKNNLDHQSIGTEMQELKYPLAHQQLSNSNVPIATNAGLQYPVRQSMQTIDDSPFKKTHSNSSIRPRSPDINKRPATRSSSGRHRKQSISSNVSTGCNRRKSSAATNSERRRHEIESGFEVAWLDFTYSIEPNIFEDPRWGKINGLFHKERRMILKGLSGGFKSGQMVALMGPSGAGKTCLLECISGVRLDGIGGRLCLRGRRKAQLVIVPQYDDFLPQFTVEEIVVYGSRMKNPPGTNHAKVANDVIEQLGLQVCRSNNIQRCSGGQRKRVAIAQELVSRPNILILDEPTSGLDSSCCYHTMKVLRDVLDQAAATDQPMAIVSTIHQPSAKVFKMFDLIYLLGKTGLTAYSGPPADLLPTIQDVTGLECPQYSNPSDFMIELVAYDYGEAPVEKLIEFERIKAKQYVKDFDRRAGISNNSNAPPSNNSNNNNNDSAAIDSVTAVISTAAISGSQQTSSQGQRLEKTARQRSNSRHDALSLGNVTPMGRLVPSKSDTHLMIKDNQTEQLMHRLKAPQLAIEHVEYKDNASLPLRKATRCDSSKHPFFWHTWVHLHRSFLQAIRDPILNNMRILIHLGFATLLVLLYGKKSGDARGCPPILGLPIEITDPNHEDMVDLSDNVGYLFMCIMMITYVSLMSTVLTFPIDIKTVGKEYKNGWYGTFTYFIGKTIADLPFITMYPVVYCLITWYMTNQANDHLWRYFSFTGLIIMNAMNSQSFGLILGALFVNSVTAATFLGPVITIPWYLFTGFTKRVHRLAEPYKTTSKFLFTRYIFEGLLDTVYGHQRCNCSEFLQKYYELRYEEAARLGQLISMETLSSLDYYDGLETVADVRNETLFPKATSGEWFEKTVDAASNVFADGGDLNLASLMETNGKASSLFSFGLDFEPTCPSNYKNYVIQDFRLEDTTMRKAFIVTAGMLSVIRVLTFLVVTWKIRTRQL